MDQNGYKTQTSGLDMIRDSNFDQKGYNDQTSGIKNEIYSFHFDDEEIADWVGCLRHNFLNDLVGYKIWGLLCLVGLRQLPNFLTQWAAPAGN